MLAIGVVTVLSEKFQGRGRISREMAKVVHLGTSPGSIIIRIANNVARSVAMTSVKPPISFLLRVFDLR